MASALIQFWSEIEWPQSPSSGDRTHGVSWTEICLSFLINRNLAVPTPVANTAAKLRDLTMLKEGGRGFFLVVKSFYWLSTWLNQQLQGAMFASLHRGMTKSMQKQGSTNQVKGFLSRPLLPSQNLVIETLRRYRLQFGRYSGLNAWPEGPMRSGDFSGEFWYQLMIPDADWAKTYDREGHVASGCWEAWCSGEDWR